MKAFKLFNAFSMAFLMCGSALSADTLLDSTNFNVTLNLAPAHYLTVGDLDFGYVNPAKLSDESNNLESTTSSVVAYSNSLAGHYVQIVPSDEKYLSKDGKAFLMRGLDKTNDDYLSFVLATYENADGSKPDGGTRTILPGDTLIAVDGSDENHKVVRSIWATLRDNTELKTVAADSYLAILTANHYSNQ